MNFITRLLLLFTLFSILWYSINYFANSINSYAQEQKYQQIIVSINNYTLTADLALSDEQRTKGLAVKDSLKENEGMLFLLDNPRSGFWMKDMKFPIDILWLNSDKEIVHIEERLEPCGSTCPSYVPDEDSKYVLETIAGFSDKHDLKEDDKVIFELP